MFIHPTNPIDWRFLAILVFALSGCATTNSISIPGYDNLSHMGASLPAHIHRPLGDGPFPTVVLMHGCGGLSSAVKIGLQSHASFLVEHGYVAIILDSFSSRGKSGGHVCNDFGELKSARFYRRIDAYNALKHLKTLPYVDSQNVFLMGQSNGGSAALQAANQFQQLDISSDLRFNAIAAFYPWCGALPKKLATPVLVLGGEKDDWTPIETCLSARSWNLEAPYKVVSYEGAYHSFDLFVPEQTFAGHTVGGNAKARDDSKHQMLSWFERFRRAN